MNSANRNGNTLTIDTPMPPPEWALLELELIKAQTEACEVFYDKYFDDRGYLLCVPRWGGNDGPDDAAENLLNWPLLHALGAPETVLELYQRGWEGHLRQYTEAKTVEVPMARDGMYFKEFPVMFDWLHHGEWLSAFILEGLSNPDDRHYVQRVRRYAAFYTGEDPLAPNYDPGNRVIRSMFNGSRGPLLRKATGLDWAGDPIEVGKRFKPAHGERTYQQMIEHFKDYNDVAGDHPLNLGATTLGFNAFALTGEEKYRKWLIDYVDAWVERTRKNNGIIPSNIGLDGSIGGACDGKWYGGVYGWGFTVINPVTGERAHRPSFYNRCYYGFSNAMLLTGDLAYMDTWRGVLDAVNANSKRINGIDHYPTMYGDEGWYNYRPEPFAPGAKELYYWTMDEADRDRAGQDPWLSYLEGDHPDYPVRTLIGDLETVRQKTQHVYEDTTTPDTRMSDDMNSINPATTETLTQLMLGGLPTGRVGSPLHCRLRYFDPDRRRAGLPPDTAALVQSLTKTGATVTIVNTNQVHARTVVVQGGAYAEHHIHTADCKGSTTHVDGADFVVRLEPGCGGSIALKMKRYMSPPVLQFPWAEGGII